MKAPSRSKDGRTAGTVVGSNVSRSRLTGGYHFYLLCSTCPSPSILYTFILIINTCLTAGNRGHVWYEVEADNLTEKHYHAWRLWKIDLPIDAEGWIELCVRAWDSSNNTQPTFVRSAWKYVPSPSLPFPRSSPSRLLLTMHATAGTSTLPPPAIASRSTVSTRLDRLRALASRRWRRMGSRALSR